MGLGWFNSIWALVDLAQYGPNGLDSTWARVELAWHGPRVRVATLPCPDVDSTLLKCRLYLVWVSNRLGLWPTQLDLGRVYSARFWPGLTLLDFCLGRLDSTLTRTNSAQLWPEQTRLDMDSGWSCLTWAWIDSAQPRSWPSQNPTQNSFWIIQKYGFGFEINPFKLIKSNMNLDNYWLDFAIWIFCPYLSTSWLRFI